MEKNAAVPVVDAAHRDTALTTLAVSAIGIVFGDIGTSPLYALKECFHHLSKDRGSLERADVLGVLSLVFWSLMLVVTIKYLMFVMRADNKGEGGIFALLALAPEKNARIRSRSGDGSGPAGDPGCGVALQRRIAYAGHIRTQRGGRPCGHEPGL